MKQKFNTGRKNKKTVKKVLVGVGAGLLALAAASGIAYGLNSRYKWVELPAWLTPETTEPVTSEQPSTSEEPVVNPTLEYQVKHSLDTSLLVEADFVKTQGTIGAPTDIYTLIVDEFKLVYVFPFGEPFSLTYTNVNNSAYGLKLEVTSAITPIESLAYLNGINLRFANAGAPGIAYFTLNDIGLPQNYVIEIIQFI